MKTRTIASFILLLLFFAAIKGDAAPLPKYGEEESAEAPKLIARNFLKWYKENRERLETFRLVNGKPGDSTQAYRVNFAETEKYLGELKKSGFFSDQYINSFRKYFIIADATLEQRPQYDGPAEGFSYDLVLKTQDSDEILDQIRKMKIIIKPVSADEAKVYLRFPRVTVAMVLMMSRSGDKWLIDSLDYV